jgi:hypothetical protein
MKRMSNAFDDYVKVTDLVVNGDDLHLIRIRTSEHTFAHIEVTKATDGCWNLRILQVTPDDHRTIVKWVAGLESEGDEKNE